MRITEENIEKYIICYFEGELTIEEKEALLQAISKNDYFKSIYDTYNLTYLKAPIIKLKDKEKIKKIAANCIINEWEDMCIKYIENLLLPEEKREFEEIIKHNDEKRKIFNLYQNTILLPDFSIVKISKNKLKRKSTFLFKYKTVKLYGLAAAVIIAFILFLPIMTNNLYQTPLLPKTKGTIAYFRKAYSKNIHITNNKQKVKSSLNYEEKSKNITIQNVNDTFLITAEIPKEEIQKEFFIEPSNAKSVNTDTTFDIDAFKEGLEKIFASQKFSYFHDIITFDEKQNTISSKNFSSLWGILQQGTKHISDITGANIKVNEFKNEYYTIKEIAIGNISFSKTTNK